MFFSTLGAAAQFRQGYITPYPVSNAVATRTKGYNVDITFTPNTINTGLTITYIANSNTGNFTGSSLSNVITISNINAFYDYTFDVIANGGAGGNSAPVTTNNVYISSNLIANGNIAAGDADAFDISPDGTKIEVVGGGSWEKYSRNNTTGILTYLGFQNFTGYDSATDVKYSADGNFIYFAVGNSSTGISRILKYTVANANLSTVGNVGNVYGDRKLQISNDNQTLLSTFRYANLIPGTLNYVRNTVNGDLTLFQSGFTPNITNLSAGTTLVEMIVTDDNKNVLQLWQNTANDRVLLNYTRNISNTLLTLNQTIDLGNALATYVDLDASPDGTSVYTARTSGINVFSRNTSTGTLTFVANISGNNPRSVEIPVNSVMLVSNTTYNRNLSNGNITVESNSSSYTYTPNAVIKTLVSPDTKNLYTLTANNIGFFDITS